MATRFLRGPIVILAGMWLIAGCKPPKYVRYTSTYGDFTCDVPWGWSSVVDAAGSDYVNATFTGPLEIGFFRGIPSFSIRWYRGESPHRLMDGTYEMYTSAEDFVRQMMRDVYGRQAQMWAGADKEIGQALANREVFPKVQRVKISGQEGTFFVVFKEQQAPKGFSYGVVRNENGDRAIVQRHAYAILPQKNGFYVLIYPATRDGYYKYQPAFFHLINTFRLLKEGPAGARV